MENINLNALIGIGILVFFLYVLLMGGRQRQYGYGYPPPSGGCLGALGSTLLFFVVLGLAVYFAYAFRYPSQEYNTRPESPNERVRNLDPTPDTLPPKTRPPIEELWGKEFQPDTNRRLNVKPRRHEVISPSLKLVDEKTMEEAVFNPPTGHFYAQKVAVATEEGAIKARNKWEASYPDRVYIGYSTADPKYPYKILIGPFEDKETARQWMRDGKTWVRDLNQEDIILLDL